MPRGEYLLEVRTEEIPARMLEPAVRELATRVFEELMARGAGPREVETGFTPRRLLLVLGGLPEREPDREEQVMGPPVKAAFAPDGSPTPALAGFAKRLGVEPAAVQRVATDKGEYVAATRRVEGRPTPAMLAEIVPRVLSGIAWAKTMRWGAGEGPWVRPVHGVVSLFDGEVVPFALCGVAAGDETVGHPILSPKPFRVRSAADYRKKLAGRGLVVTPAERRRTLLEGMRERAEALGGRLVEDAPLLDKLTAICEVPGVLEGSFDERFLELPAEVLTTSLRDHQSALTVEAHGADGHDGRGLLPAFLTVMDRPDDPAGRVRAGNEWVVAARLADARFFYGEDRKRRLDERAGQLAHLSFHEKLGSYAEKAERLAQLAEAIAGQLGWTAEAPAAATAAAAGWAARLLKADLVTEMVKEFTSLQGIMGGIYAREDGFPEEVWQAIYDQYLPASAEDPIPRGTIGRIAGLADRMDTLVGIFGLGLVPTGSRDPFGLRRAAQGVVRIALEGALPLDLDLVAAKAVRLYGDRLARGAEQILDDLRPFLHDRIRYVLGVGGYAYDEIEAALAVGGGNLPDLEARVEALHRVREEAGFLSVVLAAKRIVNIVKDAPEREMEPGLLVEPAEKDLAAAHRTLKTEVEEAAAVSDYERCLRRIAAFAPALDRFFVEVLVMDEDPRLRANRIALLQAIGRTVSRTAKLTEMVVDKAEQRAKGKRGRCPPRPGASYYPSSIDPGGAGMASKHVYAFGGGTADGRGDQKKLLGGKGAGLAEMSRLGIPVPPGFTITTEVCAHVQAHDGGYPEGLEAEVEEHLARLEERLGQRFGDPGAPLLVSVRSGAPMSMPGMMDTILNLGLNDEIIAAQVERGGDARFLYDAYRRLLTMYGDVVLDVSRHGFEEILTAAREATGAATDADLRADALAEVCRRSERLIVERGQSFPQDARGQLWGGVAAVFQSWGNPRAKAYRRLNDISESLGTAVNVQAMVFGNRGSDCATGVAFTRNPATGERRVFGEYLTNAQGEDVVAGIRTPREIVSQDGAGGLDTEFPAAHGALEAVCERLERHYRDMQDVEFTIQHGELYMLQTRTGKRTGPAAVRIAAEMVAEGLIDATEAIHRVEPQHVEQMLAPVFDTKEKDEAMKGGRLLAKGLPAGPGAACGKIALTADRAAEMAAAGPVLLVRAETSPEDIVGMHASSGILTSRGGMTSHAAVVARGLGKPCIVGAGELTVDDRAGELRVGGKVFREGDELSIDGTTGEVIAGGLSPRPSEVVRALVHGGAADSPATPAVTAFVKILEYADAERRMRVRANADTPHDARVARALGAEGIGLCRTEHMFFDEERIPLVRRMILASDAEGRRQPLAALLPMQQGDFEGIFAALGGLPVTVRLLDPPLHEFLPHGQKALERLARDMGVAPEEVAAKAEALAEANPMLGHRGCRLGMTAPDIYEMQVEAIARAACARARAGEEVRPEIMVPLVGTVEEMVRLRQRTAAVVERVLREEGQAIEILIGTMIEVPRAALVAGKIAEHADFFSFGTNDLTQMTYGYSRDDVGKFLPQYLEQGVLGWDPFARIDDEGVGELVKIACERGRQAREHLHLGVCGEHGGDAASVGFFERVGLDYVSCSPYRVPIARLAAARAKLGLGAGGKDVS